MYTLLESQTVSEEIDFNSSAILLHGDVMANLEKLPDNFFKLIITSPPYNIGKIYEQQTSLDDYLIWQSAVIEQLFRVCNHSGSIVWQIGNYIENGEVFPLDIHFYPLFKKLGFKLRNRIVWHFGHGLHASRRFSGRYEVLLWFTKADSYIFNLDDVRVPSKYPGKRHFKGDKIGKPSGNPLGKNPSDYWEILDTEFDCSIIEIPNVKANHPEKTIHPCSFPIELVERCVLAFTNVEDWVLDPFGGVGSSVVAALKRCRRAIMIEKEKEYVTIAKKRLQQLKRGSLKIRQIGTPIFTPTGKEKVSQIPLEWATIQKKV
jgi:DNA modification methylase